MELSTLDYWYLLREWQPLIGGRIQKIYMVDHTLFLHVYKGGTFWWVFRDNESFLTTAKVSFPQTPGGFTMFLRKRLQGTRISNIELLGFDRIVKITVETKQGPIELIIELFGKINIIVCQQGKIVSALETHSYTDRVVRGGVAYIPPPARTAPWDADATVVIGKEAGKSIAVDLGVGGKYSEEIIKRLNVDRKHKLADAKQLQTIIGSIRDEPLDARENGKEAVPFAFGGTGEWTKHATFNEAIDAVERITLESEENKEQVKAHTERQTKQEKIIAAQKKQLEHLQAVIEENQKKGERIYEEYAALDSLLQQIQQDWKRMTFAQVKEKYKEHPLIKSLEPDGTLEVEL